MGHSYGAGVGIAFTRLYPGYVEKLIVIDYLSPYIEAKDSEQYLKDHFNAVMRIHEKRVDSNQPTYTKDEVIEKICNARMGEQLSIEAGTCMAERVMIPAGE